MILPLLHRLQPDNGIGHEKDPELNLTGVQALGLGMATLFHELGVEPKVVTGHDYRSISQPIKNVHRWIELPESIKKRSINCLMILL